MVKGRRMTRAFQPRPLDPAVVDAVIDLARRSPTAGNTAGVEFLVLDGVAVADYWDVTLAPQRRAGFAWPGLLQAPVLVIPWVQPDAYVARYGETDKARTGLGAGVEAWDVPYWWVDGGMAAMTVLLGAQAYGLGALFFGLFDHEPAVRSRFGVPETHRAIGAIALGHADEDQDRQSRSAVRGRPPFGSVVHRGGW